MRDFEGAAEGGDPPPTCPNCGVTVPWGSILIEYERDDGSLGQFAECPSGGVLVDPE
jgi:hypothetical protein